MVRSSVYLISLVAVALIVLLNLPLPVSSRFKSASRDNITPFQLLAGSLSRKTNGMIPVPGEARRLASEVQRLNTLATELQLQVNSLKHLEQENEVLQAQLNYRREQGHGLLFCRVIGRGDASGWWQTMTLDKGAVDGVTSNMPVVVAEGLVGRTSEVTKHTCDVMLITDPGCRASCRLEGANMLGILRGQGAVPFGKAGIEMISAVQPCSMDYIARDRPIVAGDKVVTSGLGGIYPEDILVGRVVEAKPDPSGLFQQANVIPSVDLGALRFVFVMTNQAIARGGK